MTHKMCVCLAPITNPITLRNRADPRTDYSVSAGHRKKRATECCRTTIEQRTRKPSQTSDRRLTSCRRFRAIESVALHSVYMYVNFTLRAFRSSGRPTAIESTHGHPSSHDHIVHINCASIAVLVDACVVDQSQPFSLIMCAFSMMNLPSLYFWLDSKACSCGIVCRIGFMVREWRHRMFALTYFQPNGVLQHLQ